MLPEPVHFVGARQEHGSRRGAGAQGMTGNQSGAISGDDVMRTGIARCVNGPEEWTLCASAPLRLCGRKRTEPQQRLQRMEQRRCARRGESWGRHFSVISNVAPWRGRAAVAAALRPAWLTVTR